MTLSISNIAWSPNMDHEMYHRMVELGFKGLEIAPTRVFPSLPYERLDEARSWERELWENYGMGIASMQSIWYGRSENIFGSDEERRTLVDYTKKAILFAEALGCGNLVFGCPRNRSIPDGGSVDAVVPFFEELGEYAHQHHTVLAIEANPPIYHTNFLNTTAEVIAFIGKVDSKGIRLNLDVGTMLENGEDSSVFRGKEHLVNHVHISEPGLGQIRKRNLHRELAGALRKANYQNFVSIEVGKQEDMRKLHEMMEYVAEVFG